MDVRYERTEQNLIDACLELGKKRPLRSLGVKEVSAKANINRITFYSHYANIDELADHIEDMAVKEWIAFMDPVTDYLCHTEAFIRRSLKFTNENRFGSYLMPGFHGNYNNRAYDALCEKILAETNIKDERMKKRLYFALHGSASLFYLNLVNNNSDIRETAEMIHTIVNGSYSSR